ncbi:3,4-dihydroxy-2-butanone 4-phosphate synthase [Nocardia kruczakiae]|uniref:3,4-dihydroxy-2-butanone-4-phosphate synthase n=1 Tax=Nocardia kruczakiae TaxID=261477 RepID=A0ABU1XR46_9NOCA|nr:3,4-dihydroxy-2-butanone-4-phosphate synthase [Nocardia kruczakiae]MDR7173031.1 3,4-dihydroxy-2-butanone 4-phosphate synthase [Nocardia kruczakiae]
MSVAEIKPMSPIDARQTDRARVEQAAADLAAGRSIVLFDPTCGEANLVAAAEFVTTDSVAFMVHYTSGFVKVAVPEEDCVRLLLPPMWQFGGFDASSVPAVTVDAVEGTGTGISAADRARTIRTIADPRTVPTALSRPGHVAPIIARRGGSGVAESVVQLMRVAGLRPMAALCELVSPTDPTRMADEQESIDFARDHALTFVSVFDAVTFTH